MKHSSRHLVCIEVSITGASSELMTLSAVPREWPAREKCRMMFDINRLQYLSPKKLDDTTVTRDREPDMLSSRELQIIRKSSSLRAGLMPAFDEPERERFDSVPDVHVD